MRAGRRDGRLPLPGLRTGWDEQTGRAEETDGEIEEDVPDKSDGLAGRSERTSRARGNRMRAGRRDGRLPLPDLRTGWDEQTGRAEETGPKCRQEVAEPRTAQQKSVPPDLPG